MFSSHPKHSGVYYLKDGIENLQIKVNFRSIGSLLQLPKFEFHNKQGVGYPWKTGNFTATSGDDGDNSLTTVTLKWQQKILSQVEREIYREEKNCILEQHKKYHQQLKEEERAANLKEKGKSSRKKRHKKSVKIDTPEVQASEWNNIIFSYIEADHFQPKDDPVYSSKVSKKLLDATEPCESMYIYAALKPDTQLVAMKWFAKQNLFYIYPDFNQFDIQPYYIELDTDYRHLYVYGIEDISSKFKPEKKETEEFLYLPELSTHWLYEDELSKKFSMPPKRTQRCAILFTIQEVSNLEYDNIHIRYSIKLPPNTLLEEGLLEASTHSASHNSDSTHIGYTWQITVLCEEHFDPSDCLRIYFEVISIDSWLRERTEGYCHHTLRLLKPFCHDVELQCLLPTESLIDSMNRYFIGGRRKFDYVRFVDDRNGKEEDSDTVHCRYGVRMRNSGQLKLTCQALTQRNCELLNPCASRTSGMTLDDIMMAYKEARRRLEAIAFK